MYEISWPENSDEVEIDLIKANTGDWVKIGNSNLEIFVTLRFGSYGDPPEGWIDIRYIDDPATPVNPSDTSSEVPD